MLLYYNVPYWTIVDHNMLRKHFKKSQKKEGVPQSNGDVSGERVVSPIPTNVFHLPKDLFLSNIFSHLSSENIARLRRVNKQFRRLIDEGDTFWKQRSGLHFPYRFPSANDPKMNEAIGYRDFSNAYQEEHHLLPKGIFNLFSQSNEYSKRELFSIVKEGNLGLVKEKIKTFDDLEFALKLADREGKSIFYWALLNGHQPILDYFYSLTINSKDYTKLLRFAIYCHQSTEIIEELLAKLNITNNIDDFEDGTGFNSTLLCLAIDILPPSYKNDDYYLRTIHLLLNKGANPIKVGHLGYWSPIDLAAKKGDMKLLPILFEKTHNTPNLRKAIKLAAKNGHLKVVKYLVEEHNAAVDFPPHEDAPLHVAIENGHLEVVKYLVEQRANLFALNEGMQTAFDLANKRRDLAILNVLNIRRIEDYYERYLKEKETEQVLAANPADLEAEKIPIDQFIKRLKSTQQKMESLPEASLLKKPAQEALHSILDLPYLPRYIPALDSGLESIENIIDDPSNPDNQTNLAKAALAIGNINNVKNKGERAAGKMLMLLGVTLIISTIALTAVTMGVGVPAMVAVVGIIGLIAGLTVLPSASLAATFAGHYLLTKNHYSRLQKTEKSVEKIRTVAKTMRQ